MNMAKQIEIVSGEGTGEGTVEDYDGATTARAIKARLTRERCGGDRWAFVRVDGQRVSDEDIASVFTVPRVPDWKNYAQFSTVREYLDEQARLRALLTSTEIVQASPDDTDTLGNLAAQHLVYLSDQCKRAAWDYTAEVTLREAGLL